MASTQTDSASMDWWYREKQRRQTRFLIFLMLLLVLIGFFYWKSAYGRIGAVGDINFDTANHIVFVHQDTGGQLALYAVRADGSGQRMLTGPDDRSNKQDPTWTADGKGILYASNKVDGRVSQIYILGNGETKQLTYGTGNKFAPAASPDGKRVAFVTQGAIKTVLLNGADVLQVLPPPRQSSAPSDDPTAMTQELEPQGPFLNALFSEDGKGIAGVQSLSVEDNPVNFGELIPGAQVARAVPPTGDRALILATGREVSLAWDPRGNRIACSYTELETKINDKTALVSGINLYDFSKGDKPEATSLLATLGYTLIPRSIAWSPDGSRLAFEGWRLKGDGDRELRGITMMDVGRPGSIRTPQEAEKIPYLIPITAQGKPQNPRWSPDGTRLLYEMMRSDGKRDLWVVNYDGSNPINLTRDLQGDNYQGAWSPARAK